MDNVIIRKPQKSDAKDIYSLIEETKILDLNSEYLYLLQTTHFRDTCAVAVDDEKIIGFVSGYIHPTNENTLFVWQVGINEKYRGKGIAKKIIEFILNKNQSTNIEYIETTISNSNKSSNSLFFKLSKSLDANISLEKFFLKSDFTNAHEGEVLYKIGPIK